MPPDAPEPALAPRQHDLRTTVLGQTLGQARPELLATSGINPAILLETEMKPSRRRRKPDLAHRGIAAHYERGTIGAVDLQQLAAALGVSINAAGIKPILDRVKNAIAGLQELLFGHARLNW